MIAFFFFFSGGVRQGKSGDGSVEVVVCVWGGLPRRCIIIISILGHMPVYCAHTHTHVHA